jgi:hypothetical protein
LTGASSKRFDVAVRLRAHSWTHKGRFQDSSEALERASQAPHLMKDVHLLALA